MNVLWIMADHFRGDCMGCAGHEVVRTPNLDRLAARGTHFTNAYTVSPLCCPSRMSFFTGRYVHDHRVWWNGLSARPGLALLPDVFRQAGYRTGLIGKLHFYPQDQAYGFDHRELHEEGMWDPTVPNAYHNWYKQKHGGRSPVDQTEWFGNRHAETGVCDMPEDDEQTFWAAERAGAFMAENRDRPFFCFTSFIRPHSPYNPLRRFLDLYRDEAVEPPDFSREELDALPPRVRAQIEAHGWDQLGPEDFREVRRCYYALCSQVDAAVGQLLDRLESLGLAGNTIVVFAADHGDFVGEHGAMHKMHLWDGSIHIPMIVADPREAGGQCAKGLVESIDLMPTLLDLCGVPFDESIQGRSFAPALRDPALPGRDAVFAEYAYHSVTQDVCRVRDSCADLNTVSVRTDRWKYIHYPYEAGGELYDLARDPGEQRNLYADPAFQHVRYDLQARLLDWRLSWRESGYDPSDASNHFFATYYARRGRSEAV